MAIKLECPRCKTRLQAPTKAAGSYVHCPRCKGRLWVPKDAAEVAPPAASGDPVDDASAVGTPKTGLAPARGRKVSPPVPAPAKKVARFIAAEAVDSSLQLAADGKLPELQLEENLAGRPSEKKARSSNPMLVLGAIAASITLSMLLVLWDTSSSSGPAAQRSAEIRQMIESQYFGAENPGNRELEPYQILLRRAQRAYARGDLKTERAEYRKVLELLRSERGTYERGLTGDRSRDKKLETAITELLGGG